MNFASLKILTKTQKQIIRISRNGENIRNQSLSVGQKTIVRRKAINPSRRILRRFTLRSRKRMVRFSLLTTNLALLGVVVFFVTRNPAHIQAVRQNTEPLTNATNQLAGPLDQVSSADIAVHVARIANLPEAVSVVNHADSVSATAFTTSADTSVVAKPQVVSGVLPSRKDIHVYTTLAGDTISSIANKFGNTSESLKWSNGLSGDSIAVGRQIVLPPIGVNGIVYNVRSGDTPDSLAKKYSTDKDLLISFNDAEISGLVVGEQILIPNGKIAAVTAATVTYNYFAIPGGGGAYAGGWCTDYASRVGGAPGNWGNANTWSIYAARTPGWVVSKIPQPGAIAYRANGGLGHVGIVDAVSPDGTMIKYSDMNGLAGFGRVGYSEWVPALADYNGFIYRQ